MGMHWGRLVAFAAVNREREMDFFLQVITS